MSSAEPGLALLEALRVLQISARELETETKRPFQSTAESFRKLSKLIEKLGQARQARPARCPLEFVKQWEEVLSGSRESLDHRAVRYLCWNPNVATDRSFQYFLDRSHAILNPRSLQGLVASCHSRWSDQFAKSQVV